MNMDIIAVNTHTYNVYDFLRDGESQEHLLSRANAYREESISKCENILADLKKKNPDNVDSIAYFQQRLDAVNKDTYQVMTWVEYEKAQREYLLSDDLKEVTLEQWNYALNVLPPLKWCVRNGVEMFCMSEMWTGSYTTQYARYNGKYYSKMVDCKDPSTWINHILVA